MAEIAGLIQILAAVTGVDQRLGTGLTYFHPTGAKALTDRQIARITISNPLSNSGDISIAREALAGTKRLTLAPGQTMEWSSQLPGERLRLGDFYVTTVGAETAEVSYSLR